MRYFSVKILSSLLLLVCVACAVKNPQIHLPTLDPACIMPVDQTIHFAKNSTMVHPVSYPILEDVANIIRQNRNTICKVKLEGYSDSLGTDKGNYKTALRRAEVVKKELILRGISPELLETVSYGETHPIDINNTAEGRARNRRVEFRVEYCPSVESKPVLP